MRPLDQQIECVEREIALRKRVYPRLVAKGNMTSWRAEEEIARMEAVLESLLAQVTA